MTLGVVGCVTCGSYWIVEDLRTSETGEYPVSSRHDAHETSILTGIRPSWDDVCFGVTLDLDVDFPPDVFYGDVEFREVLDAVPELRPFGHLLRTYYGVLETTESEWASVVTVGRHPAATGGRRRLVCLGKTARRRHGVFGGNAGTGLVVLNKNGLDQVVVVLLNFFENGSFNKVY